MALICWFIPVSLTLPVMWGVNRRMRSDSRARRFVLLGWGLALVSWTLSCNFAWFPGEFLGHFLTGVITLQLLRALMQSLRQPSAPAS